jgi:hypothetical protein
MPAMEKHSSLFPGEFMAKILTARFCFRRGRRRRGSVGGLGRGCRHPHGVNIKKLLPPSSLSIREKSWTVYPGDTKGGSITVQLTKGGSITVQLTSCLTCLD